MTTWYDYMVRTSKHAGIDGDLWFRYLYKLIQYDSTKLITDDVKQLLKDLILTPFQKTPLQDAFTDVLVAFFLSITISEVRKMLMFFIKRIVKSEVLLQKLVMILV